MNILAYVHLRNIHNSTGAGRVARQMVENLHRQPNVNLRILADADDHSRVVPQVGEPWTAFRYHHLPHETSRQQALWYLLRSPNAEAFWPEADIMYCTAESYVPVKKSRLAVTLHDAAYFEQGAHQADSQFWKQRLKWTLLYKTLARRADMFHTVSHFSAERLSHFFPALRSRMKVVHNAVPPRFFQPPSPEGDAYLRENGLAGEPYILLPRGLAHRKNADLVLRAWPILREKHPDLKLVITSHSDSVYAERARALGPSVHLTGFVPDEALCSLYTSARLVWFPSLYEGFGLPVVEAMACGTPVVASNSSSLPEIAGGAALMVAPTVLEEHVDAIGHLLQDQRLSAEMREKGRLRANQFNWQSAAAQLTEHFAQLI